MIIDALNRTFLLMRTDLDPAVPDGILLDALRSTTVVLAADAEALSTHSGQCAFITAAMLMARSGHSVWLAAPEAELIGPQPPLEGERLIAGLRSLGEDLLPDWRFEDSPVPQSVSLTVFFGAPAVGHCSELAMHADADDWTGRLAEAAGGWSGGEWPLGGLAAAVLAAGEAFKVAMRKLRPFALSPPMFEEVYAPAPGAEVALAPAGTPKVASLGRFDVVSAGAIGNALFHVLLRLPGVSGNSRVIDHDESALSNLNRNALLRRSRLDRPKVDDLASYGGGLVIEPVPNRFSGNGEEALADVVLVGVDHIPSRWAAQRTGPLWLGIGATERFAVQVSFHRPGTACAQCLHPNDAPLDGDIPTASFVSYWAGLLLATAFLQLAAGKPAGDEEQQAYFSPLRPESWACARSGITPVPGCPTCGRRWMEAAE